MCEDVSIHTCPYTYTVTDSLLQKYIIFIHFQSIAVKLIDIYLHIK